MPTHKLAIKLFLDGVSDLHAETFVPMFHSWIQQQVMEDHLLIDVADYEHVAAGPGTVLVAHEANIHIDRGENRPGVLYVRKQPIAGAETFADGLRACLRWTLQAAARVEADLGGQARVRTNEVVLRINDRLHAPNKPETFTQVKGEIEAVLDNLYGGGINLEHRPDPLTLFEVRIRPAKEPPVNALLESLPAAVAP